MKPSSRPVRIAKRLFYRTFHAKRSVHTITTRCCGLRFRFASNCRIGEELYANAFERTQRGILDTIIRPGSIVLDIGANIGFYTCLFAQKVGTSGKVFAIEPTPSVFQTLQANVSLNGFDDRVTAIPAALSDCQGTAEMNIYAEGEEVYNSLGAADSPWSASPEGTIEVETKTLDSLLEQIPTTAPCFVKIDVEGFQHQVLAGGISQLRRMSNIAMMVEMNDATSQQCGVKAAETLDLLSSCGFHPYTSNDGKVVLPLSESEYQDVPLNRDVFFFKNSESIARAA